MAFRRSSTHTPRALFVQLISRLMHFFFLQWVLCLPSGYHKTWSGHTSLSTMFHLTECIPHHTVYQQQQAARSVIEGKICVLAWQSIVKASAKASLVLCRVHILPIWITQCLHQVFLISSLSLLPQCSSLSVTEVSSSSKSSITRLGSRSPPLMIVSSDSQSSQSL